MSDDLFHHLKAKSLLLLLLLFCVACASNNRPTYNPPVQVQQQPGQYMQNGPRPDGYYYSQQPAPSYYGGYQAPAPASRYYTNPYAFPPQNSYPYYDGDQYYVPPTYYGVNRDNNAPNAANQKF